MSRNIEVKARVEDFASVERRARTLGAVQVLDVRQRDVFFRVPEGYLKLRTADGATTGEIIRYHRERTAAVRPSDYEIEVVEDTAAAERRLSKQHGVLGLVEKRRRVLRWRHTRIHLDEVDGLGTFVEVETVIEGIGEDEAREEAARVVHALGLDPARFEAVPYRELVEAGERQSC
jgi:predicted adenylyl cyclase CyaB